MIGTNGTAFFTLSPARNAPFDITIRVYSGDEVRILENSVRAGLSITSSSIDFVAHQTVSFYDSNHAFHISGL